MEDSRQKPDGNAPLVRAWDSAELDRRITRLEEALPKIENIHLERHTKFITIIFGCMTAFIAFCGIMLTVLAALSKSDTREATKDMQGQVNKVVDDMDKKFAALSGEALKKPELHIACQNGPLDGHIFDNWGGHPPAVDLGPLFIKNAGNKRSDTLSIRLYGTEDMIPMSGRGIWEQAASNDSNYKYSWYLNCGTITVDAGETWTLDRSLTFQLNTPATNFNFRMLVFYGGENPAEAEFAVKFK